MPLLETIRTRLSAQSVFDGVTWYCTIGFLPPEPDKHIALIPTGGFAADTLARENVLPTFQVIVRSDQFGFAACETKWWDMYNALQDAAWSDVSPDTLEGYALIQAMASGPLSLGQDENQRPILSANFRVVKAI